MYTFNSISVFSENLPLHVPLYSLYDVITWNGIRYTIFNCFELANINHRGLFKSQIDVMLAVEVNNDTNYYGNIAEATCRDLHCYFIQSNTSEYGDSRVVVPKKTEEMNPVRVKGGENDTILTMKLDIGALRLFQSQDPLYQQPEDKKFKSYYCRYWEENGLIKYDVGSWSEFFYLEF